MDVALRGEIYPFQKDKIKIPNRIANGESALTDVTTKTVRSAPSVASMRRQSRPKETPGNLSSNRHLPFPAKIFIFSLIAPLLFSVGTLRLTPNRVILLLWVVPLLFLLLRGKAGRILFPDITIFLLCLWAALALIVNHGVSTMVQPIGIFFIETMGAYLLGRVYIRDAGSFYAMVRILFITVLLMLPVAIIENLTKQNILLMAFETIGQTYRQANMEPRWGFFRAQGAFQHPILLGVYSGSVIALSYFVLGYGRRFSGKIWRTLSILFTTLTSLSSGPLTAVTAQIGLITWDILFQKQKRRWWILAGLAVFSWIFVDIFSNRSPPEVFITYFAFNQATAWNRIAIWIYGSASVVSNPLFGIGFNGWVRPYYMSTSMDMYWLLTTVRYGLPGGLLMFFSWAWIFAKVTFHKGLNDEQSAYRHGFIACMIGFFLVGWTVHFWNETYVLFFFLMGSGSWFLEAGKADEIPQSTARKSSAGRQIPTRVRKKGRVNSTDEPHQKRGSPSRRRAVD